MASRRRETTQYNTYGSVAYAPAYEGGAIRLPRREEEQHRRPQPKQREHVRRQELKRAQVQVRQAGHVAPFAVIGFLAVAAFAVLLLLSHVQYTVLNGEVASLRSQMTKLQTENATLSAQYEKVFDLDTIHRRPGGIYRSVRAGQRGAVRPGGGPGRSVRGHPKREDHCGRHDRIFPLKRA